MAQMNKRRVGVPLKTHEGAPAFRETPVKALERVLCAHMLWEDGFYLNGESNAQALTQAVSKAANAAPNETRELILHARKTMNIRHAPLLAAVEYAKGRHPMARALIRQIISRADEMAEVLTMAGAKKAPHAVIKGVSDVFESDQFDEYQYGKYKGASKDMTLRDAVFITHPNPTKNPLIQKIVDETLEIPNTWETRLSAGEDKRAVFTDLLETNKLGAMALLRNLRNMDQAQVDPLLISKALQNANWSKVLPFRFMSAVKEASMYAMELDEAFAEAVKGSPQLPGKTAVLIDHSGSMTHPLSAKSSVTMREAANALAASINGSAVDVVVWATSAKQVANWKSLAGAMSYGANVGYGTDPNPAIKLALKGKPDRIIMLTDMQFSDRALMTSSDVACYTINLSPYGNPGMTQGAPGQWAHFTGFSQNVLKFIAEQEKISPF